MTSEVLYRKWRPQVFADVAGQEPIIRTLMNALAAGRPAHAYLFTGPRGTGKTTVGRLLAKAVNCPEGKDGEPCNACESCRAFLEGRALDLIELDAASNRGIDEVRSLRDKVGFAPAAGAYKLYLVDEVHMLTEPAFNALLKTLEEPPPHVIFVLATTEPHKVPATIVSRCQRFDFRRVPVPAIVGRLERICKEERITCPKGGLELMARMATGSMRDAINFLEQAVDYHGRKLTLDSVQSSLGLTGDVRSGELARQALKGELAPGLEVLASVKDDGLDLRQFQREVMGHLRNLLLVKAGAEAGLHLSAEQMQEAKATADEAEAETILRALRAFGQADLRGEPHSPLPLELALAECVMAGRGEETAAAPVRPSAPQRAAAEGEPTPATPARPTGERPSRISAWAASEEEKPAPEPAAVAPQPAEAPAPAAPPDEEAEAAPASEESPELAAVRAKWDQIYTLARQLNFKAGALLNSGCDIVAVEGQEVVFGFRHQTLLDRMTSGDGGDNLRALQEAVEQVLGQGYRVRCVLDPQAGAGRSGRRSSQGGHLIEAARQMGARVVPDNP
jgi:DNA polymerase-3 subunit gamma/tau